MFPKRIINNSLAREYYQDGSNKLAQIMATRESDMSNLASALDSHFAAIGAGLNEFKLSIDMLFERIDNLERRMR